MSSKFSILVSSCDAYEDCWNPFFTLFNQYWPQCEVPIVLNTETKSFTYPGLDIVCPTPCKTDKRRYAWGERLLKSLDFIESEIVLLMLDDFFIKSPVQVDRIYELVDLMYRDNLSHILLTNASGPNRRSSYPLLLEREQHAAYRLCLQIGLWRKSRLRFYIRGHENSWLTEIWGTKRAWRVKDTFFCIDKSLQQTQGKIIDYDMTGAITRGKWNEEKVVELFKKHGINMDFSVRGFHKAREQAPFPAVLERKLRKFPLVFRSWIELLLMDLSF